MPGIGGTSSHSFIGLFLRASALVMPWLFAITDETCRSSLEAGPAIPADVSTPQVSLLGARPARPAAARRRQGQKTAQGHRSRRPAAACPGGRTAPPKIATPRPAQPEQGWLRALRVPHRCAAPLASTRAVRAGSFRAQNGERTDTSAGCSARQQQRQDLGLGAAPRKCQLDLRARAQRRQPPPSLSTAPQWPRRTAPFRALFGPIQKSEFCANAL